MRNMFLLLGCSLILMSARPPVWSKTGHRVVGEIAAGHLSRKANRAVADLLDGRSLAEVSNFGDDIKSDTAYRRFGPWHYVNLARDARYGDTEPNPSGDIVRGIEHCLAVLRDPASPRSERVFYLKFLVHLVGDLHQPMHVGRPDDRGGNDFQVRWFDNGTNLHRVWDSHLIDDFGMSYTELAAALPEPSRGEVRAWQSGSVTDWVHEGQALANRVYDGLEPGEKLQFRYSYMWWDTVETQLLKGGVRLAGLLNAALD